LRTGVSRIGLAGALLAGALPAAASSTGAELYAKHCIACHQAEGEGMPGMAPPIAGVLANRAALPEGQDFFAKLLVNGMSGVIITQGQRFIGNMPPVAALANEELAAIINHVLSSFNASPVQLTAEAFARARLAPLPPDEVRKLRDRVVKMAGE
jgi:mono/diheme cytochrome c family protein